MSLWHNLTTTRWNQVGKVNGTTHFTITLLDTIGWWAIQFFFKNWASTKKKKAPTAPTRHWAAWHAHRHPCWHCRWPRPVWQGRRTWMNTFRFHQTWLASWEIPYQCRVSWENTRKSFTCGTHQTKRIFTNHGGCIEYWIQSDWSWEKPCRQHIATWWYCNLNHCLGSIHIAS